MATQVQDSRKLLEMLCKQLASDGAAEAPIDYDTRDLDDDRLTESQPRFMCSLHVGSLRLSEGLLEENWFQGEGETPEAAEMHAADLALQFLGQEAEVHALLEQLDAAQQPQRQGAHGFDKRLVPVQLWQCIQKLLQGDLKDLSFDTEFLVYLADAQQHSGGWLPVGVLTQAKLVQQWAKEHLSPSLAQSRCLLAQTIKDRLLTEWSQLSPELAASSCFTIQPDGMAVRRKVEVAGCAAACQPVSDTPITCAQDQPGSTAGSRATHLETPHVPSHLPLSPAEASAIARMSAAGRADEAGEKLQALQARHQQQLEQLTGGHHTAFSAQAVSVPPEQSGASASVHHSRPPGSHPPPVRSDSLVTHTAPAAHVLAAGGTQSTVKAVLVPADPSEPVQEVSIPVGGSLLLAVADVLATSSPAADLVDSAYSRLVVWGRVGARSHRLLPPLDVLTAAPPPDDACCPEAQAAPEDSSNVQASSMVSITRSEGACLEQPASKRQRVVTPAVSASDPGNTPNTIMTEASTQPAEQPLEQARATTATSPVHHHKKHHLAHTSMQTPNRSVSGSQALPVVPTPAAPQLSSDGPPSTAGLAWPAANRVDSTVTVKEHLGPTAMDWAPGNSEVVGPRVQGAAAKAISTYMPPPPPVAGVPDSAGRRTHQQLQDPKQSPVVQQHGKHVVEVPQPTLYSLMPASSTFGEQSDPQQQQLNPRASWLSGAPVQGAALLAICRPSHDLADDTPGVRWHSFFEPDWWRCAAELLPARAYVRARHAPMVTRLPIKYMSHACWSGPLPTHLLQRYCDRMGPWIAAQQQQQDLQAVPSLYNQGSAPSQELHPTQATRQPSDQVAAEFDAVAAGGYQAGGPGVVPAEATAAEDAEVNTPGVGLDAAGRATPCLQALWEVTAEDDARASLGLSDAVKLTGQEMDRAAVEQLVLAEAAVQPVADVVMGLPAADELVPATEAAAELGMSVTTSMLAADMLAVTAAAQAGADESTMQAAMAVLAADVLAVTQPEQVGAPAGEDTASAVAAALVVAGAAVGGLLESADLALEQVDAPLLPVLLTDPAAGAADVMDEQLVQLQAPAMTTHPDSTITSLHHPTLDERADRLVVPGGQHTGPYPVWSARLADVEAPELLEVMVQACAADGTLCVGRAVTHVDHLALGEQQAALACLHELQRKDVALLLPPEHRPAALSACAAELQGSLHSTCLVQDHGHVRAPAVQPPQCHALKEPLQADIQSDALMTTGTGQHNAASVARVTYKLFLPPQPTNRSGVFDQEPDASAIMLEQASGRLTVGCGMLLPVMEQLIMMLRPGEQATASPVYVALEGCDPLDLHPRVPASLFVHKHSCAPAVPHARTPPSILSPPQQQQQHHAAPSSQVTASALDAVYLSRSLRDVFGGEQLEQIRAAAALKSLREALPASPSGSKCMDISPPGCGSTCFFKQLLTTYLPALVEVGPALQHLMGVCWDEAAAQQLRAAIQPHLLTAAEQAGVGQRPALEPSGPGASDQQQRQQEVDVTGQQPMDVARDNQPSMVHKAADVCHKVVHVAQEVLFGMGAAVHDLTAAAAARVCATGSEPGAEGAGATAVAGALPRGSDEVQSSAQVDQGKSESREQHQAPAACVVVPEALLSHAGGAHAPPPPSPPSTAQPHSAVLSQMTASLWVGDPFTSSADHQADSTWVSEATQCESVTMMEVVHRLSSDAVERCGAALLGLLRPRVLVVSSPCADYTPVLLSAMALKRQGAQASQVLAGQVLVPAVDDQPTPATLTYEDVQAVMQVWPARSVKDATPLRHPSNKFEWSRSEFRSWSSALAQDYGYDITFKEVGHTVNESEAVMALQALPPPSSPGQHRIARHLRPSDGSPPDVLLDYGAAVQLAVFTRQEVDMQVEAGTLLRGRSGQMRCVLAPTGVRLPAVELPSIPSGDVDVQTAAAAAGLGGGGDAFLPQRLARHHEHRRVQEGGDQLSAPGGLVGAGVGDELEVLYQQGLDQLGSNMQAGGEMLPATEIL